MKQILLLLFIIINIVAFALPEVDTKALQTCCSILLVCGVGVIIIILLLLKNVL
jgi:hypothetical protein